MLLEMFVTVHLLAGGAAPDTTIILGGLTDHAGCLETIAAVEGMTPRFVDITTGRPILSTLHKCVLVDTEDLRHEVDLGLQYFGPK